MSAIPTTFTMGPKQRYYHNSFFCLMNITTTSLQFNLSEKLWVMSWKQVADTRYAIKLCQNCQFWCGPIMIWFSIDLQICFCLHRPPTQLITTQTQTQTQRKKEKKKNPMTNCILIKDRNLYKLTWQKAALHYWNKIFLEILLLIFEQWTQYLHRLFRVLFQIF